MAVSPEKITLLTELSASFNSDKKLYEFTKADGKKGRAFIRVQRKASGAAASALIEGWDEASEGPKPVVWSPAASSWAHCSRHSIARCCWRRMRSSSTSLAVLTRCPIGLVL